MCLCFGNRELLPAQNLDVTHGSVTRDEPTAPKGLKRDTHRASILHFRVVPGQHFLGGQMMLETHRHRQPWVLYVTRPHSLRARGPMSETVPVYLLGGKDRF